MRRTTILSLIGCAAALVAGLGCGGGHPAVVTGGAGGGGPGGAPPPDGAGGAPLDGAGGADGAGGIMVGGPPACSDMFAQTLQTFSIDISPDDLARMQAEFISAGQL